MKTLSNRVEYLKELKKILNPNPVCMEIGVLTGTFSKQLLDNLHPKELHLVDPFENGIDPISQKEVYDSLQIKTAYSDEKCLSEVKQLFKSEIEQNIVFINKNFSTDAIKQYKTKKFDFIYIDACHIYESVLWDLENYIGKIKKGGYIGGHDYFGHPDFGVIKAVDEFCEKHGYEIILLVEANQYGDWLLSAKK
jgi:hypothetical protein